MVGDEFYKIGWRSAKIYRELENIKNGRDYNPFVITDAQKIANNCSKALNRYNLAEKDPEYYLLTQGDLINQNNEKIKEADKIIKEREIQVKEVKLTLEKIQKKEAISNESLEETEIFFKNIAKKCHPTLNIHEND